MSNQLAITEYSFDPDPYFTEAVESLSQITAESVRIFDQNGYILTDLEQIYYKEAKEHRGPWEHSFQKPWFTQGPRIEGAVLNHALLFQRKGFDEQAYDQLAMLAEQLPLVWKVAKIRPKWGLDFSIDWCDKQGNVFEILHWEWDAFQFDIVEKRKYIYETKFLSMDWDHIAKQMLKRKDEWHHLDFFAQSAWKCDYLGIEHEQFKMVCWE
jgi:hypothetical protein